MKLFRPEKAQGDLNNEFKGGNEDVARLSPVLSALKKKRGGGGGRGKGAQTEYRKFYLNIRKQFFFIVWVFECWNGLPRELADAQNPTVVLSDLMKLTA